MPEEKNLLIKENKQVADLNRVPGFDPVKLLQKSVKGQEGASDQVPQLMLKYKKLWFRLACPNGRIRLVARHLTEKIAVVEAEIYRDIGADMNRLPSPWADICGERRMVFLWVRTQRLIST